MKPQLPWATLTSTAAAIPMPASAAINGGAVRPDRGHGPVPEERDGRGPGDGEIGQQFPELTPGPCGQRPPGSLVELPRRQPARLEVLAQVRYDRITVGIGSLHRSRKIIARHGVHRVPAFLSRAVVSGFRYL